MKKSFLFSILLLLFLDLSAQTNRLPAWEKGFFDIHHINTGRGNATFCILPDGTTLVIDVGDLSPGDSLRRSTIVPNAGKTPAEWVADYIHRFHPAGEKAKIDYALLTHYHDDHIGHFNTMKIHPEGKYRLSGITELGSLISIGKLVDRGAGRPENKAANSQNKPSMLSRHLKDYWQFIDYQTNAHKLLYENFKVGSCSQIKLLHQPNGYPEFNIRNLFANGEVSNSWDSTISIRKFKEGDHPEENDLSIGIRIKYGTFDYYTGADITGINDLGASDANSMESLVAPVIGAVDVATLNHHGNRDSQNEFYVRTIRPRVWIQQSWSAGHPGHEVLRRIMSKEIYPGERDLFTNFLHPAVQTVMGKRAVDNYKSTSGHMIIRVYPPGEKYTVFILDDTSEERKIIAQYPYQSR